MFTHALNLIGDAFERDINTVFTHWAYPNSICTNMLRKGGLFGFGDITIHKPIRKKKSEILCEDISIMDQIPSESSTVQ